MDGVMDTSLGPLAGSHKLVPRRRLIMDERRDGHLIGAPSKPPEARAVVAEVSEVEEPRLRLLNPA